ncbi:MAG: bifunctional DNA primase/polymerase [Candidatus Bathyarchaeia archaeon]
MLEVIGLCPWPKRQYSRPLVLTGNIETALGNIETVLEIEFCDSYDVFCRISLKHKNLFLSLDSSADGTEASYTVASLAYELVHKLVPEKFVRNIKHERGDWTEIEADALETINQIFDFYKTAIKIIVTAKIFHDQGLSVIPVQGKVPLVKWTQWQTERQTIEDFIALPWQKADGFSILSGSKTQDYYVAVVDYDVKNVTEEARERGKQVLQYLPRTKIETTPSGGLHLIYLTKEKPKNIIAFHDVCALEVIGENKLCVMAPSKGYEKINNELPAIIDNIESVFYNALKKAGIEKETTISGSDIFNTETWFDLGYTEPYAGKDPVCISTIMKGVQEGKRNESAIRLASYLLNFKQLDKGKVWTELVKWNKLNKPSLDEKELRTILESAERNQYVYGCNDELLKSYCQGKTKCPLGMNNLSVEDLIEEEIQKHNQIKLHPLIDFHPTLGLIFGYPLMPSYPHTSKKRPCFCGGSLKCFDSTNVRIGDSKSTCISFKEIKNTSLSDIHRSIFLLLARESSNNGGIKFPQKSLIFETLLRKERHYWWHSDDRVYLVIACWIIGTYFHPIFTFYPILIFQGERQSGKTTMLELLRNVCWNPTGRECSLREANLFRKIEGGRHTYIIDITRLSLTEDTKDVVDICENGTEKGGTVSRVAEDGSSISFEVYGPKAIGTRYNLPFTDKGIVIITEKATNKEYAKRRASILEDEEWREIIKLIFSSAIGYWQDVVNAYKSIEQTDKLVGRRFNYWAPLLAICKVFAPEHYQKLLLFAEEDSERIEKGDRLSEVEEALLIITMQEKEEKMEGYLLKDLTKKVKEILPWVESWQIVKSALQNLGIVNKIYDTKEGKKYLIDLEKAREKAKARNIKLTENEQDNTEQELSEEILWL